MDVYAIALESPESPLAEEFCGYPFHDACWTLFKEMHSPDEVDIKLLHDICLSCPIHLDQLDWGHDYGGLVAPPTNFHPWEDLEADSHFPIEYHTLERSISTMIKSDPLRIPQIDMVLRRSFNAKKAVTSHKFTKKLRNTSASRDPFVSLPLEIRQMILPYLSCKDVLNLKLSSAMFTLTPLPESFWASRFQPGFTFNHIFEARKLKSKIRSWETLFSGVKSLNLTPAYRNRRRVWSLLLQLKTLMATISSTTLQGQTTSTRFELDPRDNLSWMSAHARLVNSRKVFSHGCRILWARTVQFPKGISNIFVSFINFSNAQYITSIRFHRRNGRDICLGYIIPGNEIPMNCEIQSIKEDNYVSSYFYIAAAQKGFRAISLGRKGQKVDRWTGCARRIPRMRLLIDDSDSIVLRGGFDRFKMVSFSILRSDIDSSSPSANLGLRDTAQWFPDVPDYKLCLNEALFLDSSRDPFLYLPFNVVMFGGSQGSHLKKLIGITAWILDFDSLEGIDFCYSSEVDGQKVHTLGRCGPFPDSEPGRGEYYYGSTDSERSEPSPSSTDLKIDFPIDGPGGEVIEGIDLQQNSVFTLLTVRIRTNYGRSATFPPEHNPPLTSPFRALEPTESMVITGVYATLVSSLVNLWQFIDTKKYITPSTVNQNIKKKY